MQVVSIESLKAFGINAIKAIAICALALAVYWIAKKIFLAIVDLVKYYKAQAEKPPQSPLFQKYFSEICNLNQELDNNTEVPQDIRLRWIFWNEKVTPILENYYNDLDSEATKKEKKINNANEPEKKQQIVWRNTFNIDPRILIPFERLKFESWLAFAPYYPFRLANDYQKITYLDFTVGDYHDDK
jgi:hypothetical protein